MQEPREKPQVSQVDQFFCASVLMNQKFRRRLVLCRYGDALTEEEAAEFVDGMMGDIGMNGREASLPPRARNG